MHRFAVLTVCDKAYAKNREDVSGKEVITMAEARGYSLIHYGILGNELPFISEELVRLCDGHLADVVFTTGGTGLSTTDVTPEATLAVLERLFMGIPDALRIYSLKDSKQAMFSRAVAGTRGRTMIINLPGCPSSVKKCMDFLLEDLDDALTILKGSPVV
ncbi:MAG: Molybdopterin adenylyltransferase [Desulfovibrio sp.]